jgi:RNA polymerase sigma-70 factor (ECF subfamily)
VAARKQEHRLLLMAIAQLSTELQVVVQLYYWESMRTAEIAAVVASNESTVATRLARARKLVREHVTEMTQPGRLRDTLLADLDRWQRDAGTVATEANARTSTHHALG